MSIVLAAVDNSAVARPVVATAAAFAQLLGARLRVAHVQEDGAATARAAAQAAGAALELIDDGDTVRAIVRAVSDPQVDAVAVGARRMPGGRTPAGHVALALIAGVPKPVLVVPPEARPDGRIDTMVAPHDGSAEYRQALGDVIGLARASGMRVVVVHVHAPDSLPWFEDQPQHERDAWSREFLARHCGVPIHDLDVELRVGTPAREIGSVAREARADLIALGWRRDLTPGHASTIRELLALSDVPLLLIPAGWSAGGTSMARGTAPSVGHPAPT
jgi:nucleotide-binding universal stress UspA family protein